MTGRFGLRVPMEPIRADDPPAAASPFRWCADEREHVRQSIALILRTRPGTRPLLPGYGCRLHELLFRPNGPALRGQAMFFVAEALRLWEPRVAVTDVTVGPSDGHRADPFTLRVRVEYVLRSSPGAVEAVAVNFGDGVATLGPTPPDGDRP